MPDGSTSITDPPQQSRNTHHMVTRSKARIFKPKALVVEVVDHEPRTIDETFAHKEWREATQVEYDALIRNHTWELVPLL